MSTNTTAASFDSLIERLVGLPVKTIIAQDAGQTDKFIEENKNVKLRLGKADPRVMFRGNPLLAMDRIELSDINLEFDEKFEING